MKKKSNWKRALALGLSLIMTISMAACGDKGNGGNAPNGGGKGKEQVNNQQLAKEYVFRSMAISIPGEDENEFNVIAFRKNGDQVELLSNAYNYSDGDGQKLTLYVMKADGTMVSNSVLEAPYVIENSGYGGGSEVLDDTEGPVGEPAAESREGSTEDLDMPVDILPNDDDYTPEDYSYESFNYGNAVISASNVFGLCYHNRDAYVDGEYVSENDQTICCWDKDGKLLWKTPIDMAQYQNEEEYSYLSSIIPLADNTVGLLMVGSKNGIIQVASDGSVSKLKKSASDKDVFSRDPSITVKEDGTLLISYYDDNYTKQYLTTYDPKADSFGQEYEVPQVARYSGFYSFTTGVKHDVVYSNGEGVYGFNLGDTEVTKIMDYVNSDMATYGLNNLIFLDENSFVATYYDQVDYKQQFGVFTYVKPEDIKDKATLVFAGCYIGYDQKTNIIRFNKENEEYRIVVKDYAIYNTDEDYTQGYTKLNNDIIAGNIPDILLLNSQMPVESYVAKGLLANIDEMIKNDEELSKQEYMENVFDAYRINGVLYRVIPKFTLHTWVGKKSLIGDRTSWTMDDVKQVATKLTGKKEIFGTDYSVNTQESFLNTMLSYCGRDFVDVNTGKCNFETKLFTDLLAYAKTLPKSDEQDQGYDEEYWEEYWENYYSQYRENRVLLMELTMYDLSSLKYQIKGMIGEDVTYVGFPTESGSGSYIDSYNTYAIFDKSANKDGAWKFLRLFLTEEYQKNEDYKYGYDSGIPILKKMAREQVNKLMERPYWVDEDGNKNYYDDTYWVGSESIVLDQFTQAEADKLFDFVCGVNKTGYADEDVMKIISEEAGSFFSGSKSAQEVATMIQNRVQLYVNENR